jgi:hypothetical protein
MRFNPPVSGTWDDWRDFDTNFKKEAPVRHYLSKVVGLKLRVKWMKIKDLKWKVYHRFHPRHKYNVVRTELEPGYYDLDMRMLYACFALLVNYVEIEMSWGSKKYRDREKGLENLDYTINFNSKLPADHNEWDRMPEHQEHAAREAKELYLWWEKYRDNDDSEWDNCPVSLSEREHAYDVLSEKWRKENPELAKEWDNWSKRARAESERKLQEADEMLARLIKIRHSLWT